MHVIMCMYIHIYVSIAACLYNSAHRRLWALWMVGVLSLWLETNTNYHFLLLLPNCMYFAWAFTSPSRRTFSPYLYFMAFISICLILKTTTKKQIWYLPRSRGKLPDRFLLSPARPFCASAHNFWVIIFQQFSSSLSMLQLRVTSWGKKKKKIKEKKNTFICMDIFSPGFQSTTFSGCRVVHRSSQPHCARTFTQHHRNFCVYPSTHLEAIGCCLPSAYNLFMLLVVP